MTGDLSKVRDISDVRDIVDAYHKILTVQPEERLFVLGSGVPRKISEILSFYLTHSQKKLTHRIDESLLRKGENRGVVADATLARKVLGWQPQVPFEQTLREVYESIQ